MDVNKFHSLPQQGKGVNIFSQFGQIPVPVKTLQTVFARRPTIAVVGLSPKRHRPSHQVARYLLDAGYTLIPVNPGQDRILDLPCYPNLLSIRESVDVVDIFRRADQVLPIVQDGVSIGAKVIWMQQGIVNEEAAELARQAGLAVVMDRCIKIEHGRFMAEH